jgi:hypothetical protein
LSYEQNSKHVLKAQHTLYLLKIGSSVAAAATAPAAIAMAAGPCLTQPDLAHTVQQHNVSDSDAVDVICACRSCDFRIIDETVQTMHDVLTTLGLGNSIVAKIATFLDDVSKVRSELAGALLQRRVNSTLYVHYANSTQHRYCLAAAKLLVATRAQPRVLSATCASLTHADQLQTLVSSALLISFKSAGC